MWILIHRDGRFCAYANPAFLLAEDSEVCDCMVYFAIAHLSGTDRSQMLLLPEVVDDYVGPGNPVRRPS
ncbi:hypothetical protein ELH90_15435 [Rhizobium leguminosarum]|uniref:Uncharacterized protein n=1 Tax=Rhizobium leguminosarum TaxID=384 RepID=A0A7M3DW52_RHILE|nr:hypothetical protein ELH90_15435 [Rhizobium leguminosarum]